MCGPGLFIQRCMGSTPFCGCFGAGGDSAPQTPEASEDAGSLHPQVLVEGALFSCGSQATSCLPTAGGAPFSEPTAISGSASVAIYDDAARRPGMVVRALQSAWSRRTRTFVQPVEQVGEPPSKGRGEEPTRPRATRFRGRMAGGSNSPDRRVDGQKSRPDVVAAKARKRARTTKARKARARTGNQLGVRISSRLPHRWMCYQQRHLVHRWRCPRKGTTIPSRPLHLRRSRSSRPW